MDRAVLSYGKGITCRAGVFVMEIKTDTMESSEAAEPQQRLMCSFLKKPFPECYCMRLSSMNIPKILEFCAGEFKFCHIYQHNAHMIPPWQGTPPSTLCLLNA